MAKIIQPDGSMIEYHAFQTLTRTDSGGIALKDKYGNWAGDILSSGVVFLPDGVWHRHYPAPIAEINKAMDFVIEHAKDSNASSYKLADVKKLLNSFDAKRKDWK
jgi:hypothetical protein